jgi:[protein-PII] uridylyltransferase
MTTQASSAPLPLLEQVSPALLPELRRYVLRYRGEVETMIRSGGREGGLPAGRFYAKAFDGLLGSLFCAVQAAMTRQNHWQNVSLAAVGSYGRGAVAFSSDLDVRLLCAERAERARPIAEALLYPLWDIGLSVGHQVVTGDEMVELARDDLPTATTLLDWRTLAGEIPATRRMLDRAFEGVFGAGAIRDFLERLDRRAAARHERYGGSVYLLEPDVKNGPGGLRDLDVAHWAVRARWRVAELGDLVRIGVLVPREWQQIDLANAFLWRVRNLLHVYSGRRTDRLSFDRQEQLAVDLGYGSGGPAVERFMSDYYRHARVLAQAREMVLGRALPPPTRRPRAVSIGGGLKLINGAVSLAHPGALETEPALALRLYDEAVRRELPVYGFARDAVARAASLPSFCERLRASEEAARLFMRLGTVVGITRFKNGSVLGELHDVGLLTAMVPEFAPVVGRVHHDVYHVYTVDVHSVAAVDRLRALARGELAAEHPLASRLAAEISRPRVLFFATLLHDVGKDIGGKNHSERGQKLAAEILERLHVPPSDAREVEHLVLKHLRMYHVATRRDIDDARTIEEFSRDVHGREGLRELYLLTVSDLSTTSPTAMTSWKARMLDELYVATDRYLGDGGGSRKSALGDLVRRVRQLWGKGDRAFFDHFLSAMPERYLYANEAEEVVRHARFAQASDAQSAGVRVLGSDEPYVELGFIADDRPGLLACITATLAAARLAVVGAQIYSWRDASGRVRALDMFWVRGGSDAEAVRALVPRIERDLARVLSGGVEPTALVEAHHRPSARWSERPTPEVTTKVSFDDRAASDYTVLEVTTRDRPGLLFWLANTLQQAGLSIALAKINTEGLRVADVFYVCDREGRKVGDPARVEEIRARISATIARLQAPR